MEKIALLVHQMGKMITMGNVANFIAIILLPLCFIVYYYTVEKDDNTN